MIGDMAALICAIIIFGMALLQLLLACGAPYGEYVLGGRNRVLPKKMRLVSSACSFIFIIIGMVYLQKGNILDFGLRAMAVNIIVIINTIFLAYAIVGNSVLTKSKKEKYVMTPFSIIQFILSVTSILWIFR